jgi:hypothetical protein
MSFGRDFSNFSFFIKKHLDIFDRQVFYKNELPRSRADGVSKQL